MTGHMALAERSSYVIECDSKTNGNGKTTGRGYHMFWNYLNDQIQEKDS